MNLLPLPLGRGVSVPTGAPTAVMGILNITPDSFSDGGHLIGVDAAVRAARRMARAGVRVLDVGGESTRPHAEDVPVDEELRRVVPVVRALVERVGLPVSVDTRKASVFAEAWRAGASLLNDVSGLTHDPELAAAAARTEAAVVVMHMRGNPRTMHAEAHYQDVPAQVAGEISQRVQAALMAGIPRERLLIDPGLGFAKDPGQTWELLRRIDVLQDLRLPLVVGPSRKRFLGAATGRVRPRDRDAGTLVVVGWLAERGVEMVRVHDGVGAVDAVATSDALRVGLGDRTP